MQTLQKATLLSEQLLYRQKLCITNYRHYIKISNYFNEMPEKKWKLWVTCLICDNHDFVRKK